MVPVAGIHRFQPVSICRARKTREEMYYTFFMRGVIFETKSRINLNIRETKGFFQFEVIMNISVSSFWFI